MVKLILEFYFAFGLLFGDLSANVWIPKKKVVKFGLHANIFNENLIVNEDISQSIAGFLLAVEEINNSTSILPDTRIAVAIRSGHNYAGASHAAELLLDANFSNLNTGIYLSKASFLNGDPIGVDIAISTGNDKETIQSNLILGSSFDIVQISTVAQTTALAHGSLFPRKISTVPVISFNGMVIQNIICNFMKVRKVAILSTSTDDGIYATFEVDDGVYCNIKKMIVINVDIGTTDFTQIIAHVKETGVKYFVIPYLPANLAASLLENLFDNGLLGIDTQVIGGQSLSDSSLFPYFTNKENIHNIMRGYIGVRYNSKVALYSTAIGKKFVESLTNYILSSHSSNNGVCSSKKDDTGQFIYISQSGSSCASNINLVPNDVTNISMTAPHTYDAVYAAALAFDNLLKTGKVDTNNLINQNEGWNEHNINGGSIFKTLLNNSPFIGATGVIGFYEGIAEMDYYGRGDREVGNLYEIVNFNEKMFVDSQGVDGFGVVGLWSA